MKVWQSQKLVSSFYKPNFDLNHLLQICSNSKSLDQVKQTHQKLISYGLDQHPFLATKLVQLYADCNDIKPAHHLFDELSNPTVFAWTAILAYYTRRGMPSECLSTYNVMKSTGVFPDKYVFPNVIRACAQSLCLKGGTQLHKEVISFGVEMNLQVCNALIDMYCKCGDIRSAKLVFDMMVERDLLSWNSLISGHVSNGLLELAIELFNCMRMEGFEPDRVTWNTVTDAYCRMGRCDEAQKVFENIKEPNIISWTTLISGYSRSGKHEVALSMFRDMMRRGKVCADLDCLSSALVSCRHIETLTLGREIHAYGVKNQKGILFYKSAGPALLIMYARTRRYREVVNAFNFMDKSDVVSWNAMIHGLTELGKGDSALSCFRKMQVTGIQNDQTTISTVLPTCDLKYGKQLHAYITKSEFSSVVPVLNALTHMYSKKGCIGLAYSVFSNMTSRDIVSWNAMIGAFGMHGLGQAALQLLHEMHRSGTCPNSFTFTSVLSACSHSGLVNEGLDLFNRMSTDFGSTPKMEHFACVVDLLARVGRLDDVVGFISAMPVEPNDCIWGAVLAASRTHQNIEIGVLAAERLVSLEPDNAGNYVILSNMYVGAGRWDDAIRIRKEMEVRGLVKSSGYSSIEKES